MKTIIRNFISVLRRFKLATGLNVAGLAVAFAAFIVILIQVNYERNFDRCHPTSERIFRVDLAEPGTFSTILPRAFIEAVIQSSPHIEAGSLINPYISPIYFSVMENGEKIGYRERIETCHPSLVKIFDFPILEGNPNCLSEPDKMLIPESLARKMFGNQSAVGKSIHAEESIWSKSRTDFTVGAVYSDFPGNTQVQNVIYTAMDPDFALTNFGASNYYCFLLLDNELSAQDVVDNFNRTFDFKKIGRPVEQMKLTPLTDIYYLNESQDGRIFRSGNSEVTKLLFCIALLIIIVAGINFTNFSTALTPLRIKSINTQKVLGGTEALLRRALLAESVIISMVAWLLSLLIVWILALNTALPFVEASLGLLQNLPLVLMTGLIAIATGLVAGLYPSWYITSFPPALVLKGSFGLSPSGRKLRTALIGIQFVVSILLIICAFFVRVQNNYMRSYSLGFDKDQIAIVELSGDIYDKHHETYANRLKEFTGIEDVAFTMEKVASKDGYNTNSGEYNGNNFQYFLILSSANFLQVMGIPVVDGRDFSHADEQSEEDAAIIFNGTAQKAMDMKAGDAFSFIGRNGRLVGFTGDVKFTSLRQGESNIAFVVTKIDYSMPVSYIRLKAGTDIHAAVEHIRKTLSDIEPSYPFDVEFYDTIFDQLYHKEENLHSLITVFSILAIIISLVGVFGLVIFETQYRRKEIGIRKVHGATVGEILYMFNKSYLKIVVICFIIAAPIAWYGVKIWLESFAYKIPIYWWIFLMAFLIVTTITMATVTFQNWRAANVNPVKSLKSE